MATVMDLPYHQGRFHSLPRVHPLPPLELWDDLRTDEQVLHWLHTTTWGQGSQPARPALATSQTGAGKMRVLDIVDTNRGISGQIDSYVEPEHYYPSTLPMTDARPANHSEPSNTPDMSHFELDEANFTDNHDLGNSFEFDTSNAFVAFDV